MTTAQLIFAQLAGIRAAVRELAGLVAMRRRDRQEVPEGMAGVGTPSARCDACTGRSCARNRHPEDPEHRGTADAIASREQHQTEEEKAE